MDGLLVVDKPAGPTSHDIVETVRKVAGEKRIGHAGTLDPMATGVLVLCLGKGTRIVRFLPLEPKVYTGAMILGISTSTQDVTGVVLSERAVDVGRKEVERVFQHFRGKIWQVPPMISAVKVAGRPLYKWARQGKRVEVPKRQVDVFGFELLDFTADERPTVRFSVECSSGTYVRTLCHDVGERLRCGAALSELRRERAGAFSLADAVPVADLETPKHVEAHLIGINKSLADLPYFRVGREGIERTVRGQALYGGHVLETGGAFTEGASVRVLGRGDRIVAVAELRIDPGRLGNGRLTNGRRRADVAEEEVARPMVVLEQPAGARRARAAQAARTGQAARGGGGVRHGG